jgi:hypothetical protein
MMIVLLHLQLTAVQTITGTTIGATLDAVSNLVGGLALNTAPVFWYALPVNNCYLVSLCGAGAIMIQDWRIHWYLRCGLRNSQ